MRPELESSEEDLLASYNKQVKAVQTIQATVDLIPSTGTTYSGVIEEYHDVPGFILAERPATVRIIGQAPVVAKNIFDMVANEKEFRIYIPSKNSFLVGPTTLIRPSKKPLENLRPQHVVEALFWPEFSPTANVLFEQFDFNVSRYYILTLRGRFGTTAPTCAFGECKFLEQVESLSQTLAIQIGNPHFPPRTPRQQNKRTSHETSISGGPRTTTNWKLKF